MSKIFKLVMLFGASSACTDESTPAQADLVDVYEEGPGANCAHGGQRIDFGSDADGSGILEASEVEGSVFVCDGVGVDGSDGADGADGLHSLVSTSSEPHSLHCLGGGLRVEHGLDYDRDGILDPDEVDGSETLCRDGSLAAPMACYAFEDNTNDAFEASADATAAGGTTFTTGVVGQAIELDGIDGHVVLPDLTSATDVTFAGWMQLTAAPGTWTRLFDGGKHNSTSFITVNNGRGSVTARIWNAGMNEAGPGVAIPSVGEWHHFAMTYDQEGDGLKLYVDGALVGSNPAATGGYDVWGADQNFYLGRSNWCEGCEPTLPGIVDEVFLYDRSLESTEVAGLYNQGVPVTCTDL